MADTTDDILRENTRRLQLIDTPFHPETGEGAPLKRTTIHIPDYQPPTLFLPDSMMDDPHVSRIILLGCIDLYARQEHIDRQEAAERFEVL